MIDNLVLEEMPHPGIIKLTLNRPEKRNALNIPILKSLSTLLDNLQKNSKVRVVILCGKDPLFCAGLDLQELTQSIHEEESALLLANILQQLYHMPQATIALVQGAALAGGAGLACVCDFLIMEESAYIGFPEVRRGLVAALVMLFLKKQLNERQLKELLLIGKNISARRAYEIGLVTEIVEPAQLLNAAIEISLQILKGSPQAIKETKRLMESLSSRPLSDEFKIALNFHQTARRSSEAQEGVRAFLEKRNPSWINL